MTAMALVHTLNQWLCVCLHFLQVTYLYIDQGRNEKKNKIDKNKIKIKYKGPSTP